MLPRIGYATTVGLSPPRRGDNYEAPSAASSIPVYTGTINQQRPASFVPTPWATGATWDGVFATLRARPSPGRSLQLGDRRRERPSRIFLLSI